MKKNTLFLTLKVFSATGGIEKVCRVAGKALTEIARKHGSELSIYSMWDNTADAENNPYFPITSFRGFGSQKIKFVTAAVQKGRRCDTVILSHINLLLVGWLIKKASPKTTILLLAHGIEIWKPLGKIKTMMLHSIDKILPVSAYTSQQVQQVHQMPAEKCVVLNNCLDPFLPAPQTQRKNPALMQQYGFTPDDFIVLTLTRLAETERHKGYDKVIEAIAQLQANSKRCIYYLMAGKYAATEKAHIEKLAAIAGIPGKVILTGYVADAAIAGIFELADAYVMPSKKEGFGIVFIEAMYYGLPVVAGNTDGSVDALQNGKLGQLVNPDSLEEVKTALENIVADKKAFVPDRELLMEHFGYERYKEKLGKIFER